MFRSYVWAVTAALLATPLPALADEAGEYTFTILRDGAPIGTHCIAFDQNGARTDIREATSIEVRLGIFPVYSFEHETHQIWEDGRAVRIDATTNDNGKKLHITVRPSDHGYIRTVNGRIDKFDESTVVFALWNNAMLKHHSFFSAVEDKAFEASFDFIGREKITIAGTELDVQHYHMVGDEERDLWYDAAGRIAKVRLRRLGSEIDYVRDQLTPRAPGPSGCPSG